MNRLSIFTLTLSLGAVVAVVVCPPTCVPNKPISPAETPELSRPASEVVILRAIAKNQVAREVAAGRNSLPEAAGLFRALDRLAPESAPASEWFGDDLPPNIPGRTDEERLCRQVVAYVRVALRDGPADVAAAVVARLEAEFREELRQRGTIRLPDPSELPPVQQLLEQARKLRTEAEQQRQLR
jgi:hypothetical protein